MNAPPAEPAFVDAGAYRRPPARVRMAVLAAALSLSGFPAGPLTAPVAAQTPAPAAAPPRLPALGEPISGELSVGAERRFGELIMRDVRRDPSVIDDPLLGEYLQRLWQPLVAAARQRGEITPETDGAFAWDTFLVRDRSVNAFALPGGYVGVHLGLIAMTSTPDELAAVLAHELSHVTQRHIARGLSSAQKQSLLGMAAMILGVIAASRAGNADMANAAVMGSQAAMIQGQLNFSRDMEREADRVGFGIFSEAGYAPGGVAAMFEKLDQANRLNDSGAFPYLRSHPLTIERIGEARSRVEAALARDAHRHSHGDAATAPPTSRAGAGEPVVITGQRHTPQAWLHALMQARAKVLMDTSDGALQRWLGGGAAAAAPLERATALYAAALAAARLRDSASAQAAWRQLAPLIASQAALAPRLKTDAEHPAAAAVEQALRHLRAELALAAGDGAAAWAALSGSGPVPADPRRADLMALSVAALAWSRRPDPGPAARDALDRQAERLQTWVTEQAQDAGAWSLLAQVHEALGQPLRAVRADAESRIAVGDLNGALDRLRAGQRMARAAPTPDHIEASVIDARARAVEKLRRTRFAELRGLREEDLPPVLPPNVPL